MAMYGHSLLRKNSRYWNLDVFRNLVENSNSMCDGTKHFIALFTVSAIFNAKRGREQNEREHRKRTDLRAQKNLKASRETRF